MGITVVAIFMVYEFFILNKVNFYEYIDLCVTKQLLYYVKLFVLHYTDGSVILCKIIKIKGISKVVCAISAPCTYNDHLCCDISGSQSTTKQRQPKFLQVSYR